MVGWGAAGVDMEYVAPGRPQFCLHPGAILLLKKNDSVWEEQNSLEHEFQTAY